MASFPLVSATGMLGSGFRAESQGLHFKLAVIHSELSRDVVHRHLRDGRARALPPSAPLSDTDIDAATHIVGMMGVEPIQEALKSGAQIVVAGRSSDTSIFSALPLLEGYAPAVVWHMAKILECGAAAVAVRTAPDCMMAELHEDSFDVFPLREDYHCTPQSVASHTLYENADPFELKEPSGTLRTDKARYEAISDRAVRVSGSEFMHDPEYTIKLEGVRRVGYSTILMGGVRDPYILAQIDSWLAQLDDNIKTRIRNTVGERAYEIVTRVYGRDGVMGALEPQRGSVGGDLGLDGERDRRKHSVIRLAQRGGADTGGAMLRHEHAVWCVELEHRLRIGAIQSGLVVLQDRGDSGFVSIHDLPSRVNNSVPAILAASRGCD